MNDFLDISLTSSMEYVVVSDIVTYTVNIKNTSQNTLKEIKISSLLDEDLKFIPNSVKIDYVSDPNFNIMSGIEIEELAPAASQLISFDVEVMRKTKESIDSEVTVEYKVSIDDQENYMYNSSNINKIYISNPSIKIIKQSDKSYVELNDEILYTVNIINNGDLDLQNLFFIDELPNSLEIVEGSFKINSKVVNSVNLNKGITLSNLEINKKTQIIYKVKVVMAPPKNKIISSSKVKYSYILQNQNRYYRETDQLKNSIKMTLSNFKTLNINDYFTIDKSSPLIKEINDIDTKVKIESQNIIKTPISISQEGEKLNEYKVIIHGTISQNFEYIADDEANATSSCEYKIPFSTYLILPQDFILGKKVELVSFVENIDLKKVNNETIFRSLELIIIAKL